MARFSGKQYRGASKDLRAAKRAEAEARQRRSEQGSDDPVEPSEAVES